jgi:hypothetical protein
MKMKMSLFGNLITRRRYSMNIILRRLTSALILSGLVYVSAYAGNTNRTGTAGAQELLIPVGGSGIALGGSNVAFAMGTDAIYWNPAGLSRMSVGTEAYFSHMSYIADIGVDYGAVGINFSSVGTFALSFKSIAFGNIPITTEDNPDGTGATYSPTYVVAGLSYSRILSDRISVGANFNLISETIMSTSATGFAVDAGVQYNGLIVPELKLGIVVKNLGPNMTYSGANLYHQQAGVGSSGWFSTVPASFELPSQIEMALAYDRKLNDMNDVTVYGDFENNNYSSDVFKVGLQYAFNNMIFVRGGYNFAPQAPKDVEGQSAQIYDWSLGAGFNYKLGGLDFTFDYAYRHVALLSANNVFTVKLGF